MAQNRQILNKIASRSIPGAREALDALNCLNRAVDIADWGKASQALELLRQAVDKFRSAAVERKRAAISTLSAVWPKICGDDGRVLAHPIPRKAGINAQCEDGEECSGDKPPQAYPLDKTT